MPKEIFYTDWRRKSSVGWKFPFDVTCCPPAGEKVIAPVINVTKREYDKIANTLDDFTPKMLKKFGMEKKVDKYGPHCTHKIVVITDGRRKLAVDNQGFCYPRYKGLVCRRVNCIDCEDY